MIKLTQLAFRIQTECMSFGGKKVKDRKNKQKTGKETYSQPQKRQKRPNTSKLQTQD